MLRKTQKNQNELKLEIKTDEKKLFLSASKINLCINLDNLREVEFDPAERKVTFIGKDVSYTIQNGNEHSLKSKKGNSAIAFKDE